MDGEGGREYKMLLAVTMPNLYVTGCTLLHTLFFISFIDVLFEGWGMNTEILAVFTVRQFYYGILQKIIWNQYFSHDNCFIKKYTH